MNHLRPGTFKERPSPGRYRAEFKKSDGGGALSAHQHTSTRRHGNRGPARRFPHRILFIVVLLPGSLRVFEARNNNTSVGGERQYHARLRVCV